MYGSGENSTESRKKTAPIFADGLVPIFCGSVGYPTFASPSMLIISRSMFPPMLPKLVSDMEKDATEILLKTAASPYRKDVPIMAPTRIFAKNPEYLFKTEE